MPRGRPPKPTALKVLNGNPGKRKLNLEEPKPQLSKNLQPPKYLPEHARDMWMKIVPELEKLRLLSVVDVGYLEMGCMAYARWRECEEELMLNGLIQDITREDGSSYRQQAPEVSIGKQAYEQYKGFCTEFGLTPASRTRIRAAGGQEASEDDKKFFGAA